MSNHTKTLCIGHRGARGHAPENTLLSIQTALQLCCDWIEIDVHAVAGELVVIHDRWLNKTTNGEGLVSKQTLDYLRSLNAGQGEKIPLLSEVINTINGRCGLNIEMKSPACAELLVRQLTAHLQQGIWQREQFMVSSFDHPQLASFKQQLPSVDIGLLHCGIPLDYAETAARLKAKSINLDIDFINEKIITDAHQRGLAVYVYTVNQAADISAMLALGVDGLFTDYPERVLQLREHQSANV